MPPLIIIGDSVFAEVAYEYFTHDSEYEVVAFAVEEAYLKRDKLFGLPVVPFENLEERYSPAEHKFFVAIVHTQQNRLRARLYKQAKKKGYTPASYISPRAFVWHNARIGEHCFILEDNVIQPWVEIGNDTILWIGNQLGQGSIVKNHCFIISHVVICEAVEVGEYCFIGVNATIGANLTIGNSCYIDTASTILTNLAQSQVVAGVVIEREG